MLDHYYVYDYEVLYLFLLSHLISSYSSSYYLLLLLLLFFFLVIIIIIPPNSSPFISSIVAQSHFKPELMGLIFTHGKMGAIYATAQVSESPSPKHFHLVLLLAEARQERIPVLHAAATVSN